MIIGDEELLQIIKELPKYGFNGITIEILKSFSKLTDFKLFNKKERIQMLTDYCEKHITKYTIEDNKNIEISNFNNNKYNLLKSNEIAQGGYGKVFSYIIKDTSKKEIFKNVNNVVVKTFDPSKENKKNENNEWFTNKYNLFVATFMDYLINTILYIYNKLYYKSIKLVVPIYLVAYNKTGGLISIMQKMDYVLTDLNVTEESFEIIIINNIDDKKSYEKKENSLRIKEIVCKLKILQNDLEFTHYDFKSDNLLIEGNDIYIADFGKSRINLNNIILSSTESEFDPNIDLYYLFYVYYDLYNQLENMNDSGYIKFNYPDIISFIDYYFLQKRNKLYNFSPFNFDTDDCIMDKHNIVFENADKRKKQAKEAYYNLRKKKMKEEFFIVLLMIIIGILSFYGIKKMLEGQKNKKEREDLLLKNYREKKIKDKKDQLS
jgi:hypothetical protein